MNKFKQQLLSNKLIRVLYKNFLMASLALTKFLGGGLDYMRKYDLGVPLRVSYFIDALSTSSDVAHTQISLIDEEVGDEFRQKTEVLERKIGIGKLYSKEEVEELCNKRDQLKVPESY